MNSAVTWGHSVGQLQMLGRPPRGTARQPHALCTTSCAIAGMHHLSGAAGMFGLTTAPQYHPLWWKKVPLQGAKTALCWASLQWQGFSSSSKDIFLGPDSAMGPSSSCSSTTLHAAKSLPWGPALHRSMEAANYHSFRVQSLYLFGQGGAAHNFGLSTVILTTVVTRIGPDMRHELIRAELLWHCSEIALRHRKWHPTILCSYCLLLLSLFAIKVLGSGLACWSQSNVVRYPCEWTRLSDSSSPAGAVPLP